MVHRYFVITTMSTLTNMPLIYIINNLNMTIYHMCLGFFIILTLYEWPVAWSCNIGWKFSVVLKGTVAEGHYPVFKSSTGSSLREGISRDRKSWISQLRRPLRPERERHHCPITKTLHPHKQIISLITAHHYIGCRLWDQTNWNLYLAFEKGNQLGEKPHMANMNQGYSIWSLITTHRGTLQTVLSTGVSV